MENGAENSVENSVQRNTAWSLAIVSLLCSAFFLGLPQFHYTVALMIAVILRYKDEPLGEPIFRFTLSRATPERGH